MDCSSVWNCASWVRNWTLSVGLRGSWFFICATSSCRNIFLVTVVAPGLVDAPEVAAPEEDAVFEEGRVESACEMDEIMLSSLVGLRRGCR